MPPNVADPPLNFSVPLLVKVAPVPKLRVWLPLLKSRIPLPPIENVPVLVPPPTTKIPAFTVNVPTKDLKVAVAFCGTVSGREYDKFAEKGLTAIDGEKVGVPSIEECVVHYECKVVHKNDVLREVLDGEIDASAYPAGDYHRLYYGEILGTYATEDAAEKLGEA